MNLMTACRDEKEKHRGTFRPSTAGSPRFQVRLQALQHDVLHLLGQAERPLTLLVRNSRQGTWVTEDHTVGCEHVSRG